jgi:hypothetical protein
MTQSYLGQRSGYENEVIREKYRRDVEVVGSRDGCGGGGGGGGGVPQHQLQVAEENESSSDASMTSNLDPTMASRFLAPKLLL